MTPVLKFAVLWLGLAAVGAVRADAGEPVQSASAGMPAFVQDTPPEAAEAARAVDAFSAAIKAADLSQASALLDPEVVILESGGSERSRAEYLGEHAVADAAFMQGAQQVLRYRKARVIGELAWVATESLLETGKGEGRSLLRSTETMVLRKGPQGWKIVHIHWSSRKGGPADQPG